jgi:Winged helix DNA-binding domain
VAERTLTQRELNRALLARQLLLERARSPLPRALERVAGIQAQYAPSMYIGLWSRMEGFERDALTRALERRRVVQATLMRSTIHLVAAADYWPFAVAVLEGRRTSWLRARPENLSAREMHAAGDKLAKALERDGTLRRTDIEQLVGKPQAQGVGMWLPLVRVPPSGTWERRRADLFARADDWLGPSDVTPDEGLDHLVRRYLAAFGPASRADVAGFAGLRPTQVDPALDRVQLRRFRSEQGDELLDLPRAPLPDPETPAPVRLLPTWDATLLVHARRTGILAEEHRPRIFNSRNPQSSRTFLVDGAVAGTWRFEDGKVSLDPFARLDRSTTRQLREEADRMAAFHAD